MTATDYHADAEPAPRRWRWPGRSLRILAGLVTGLAIGALLAGGQSAASVLAVTRPVGQLWIDALTMTVVPLLFSLLVTGIAGAAGSAGGAVARRAMGGFALLLVIACLASAAAMSLALTAWPVPPEAANLRSAGASAGPPPAIAAPSAWLQNIIPTNPIRAAADSAVVPVVVFALLFGFATSRIAPPLRDALLAMFCGLAEAMLVIVGWVLWVAPVGVFALAIGVGTTAGAGAAGVLVHYMLMVIGACLLALAIATLAVVVLGQMSPLRFWRAALPAQLVAMSTQSSLAALPAMLGAAAPLGVGAAIAGIVLPLSVSLFRMASAAANIAVAVYLGQLHGMALGIDALVLGAMVAAAVSVAAVGLPAQVSFFAVVGPVCLAMGVPLTLLPLLLAIETIPDVFRTVGNVTGGLAVLRIIGHRQPLMADGAMHGDERDVP